MQVVQPTIPWPRAGRFVISDHEGRLGDLAVATAVLGATDDGDVICPVAVRYRVEGRPGYLSEAEVPQRTAAIVGMRGLVVEVHCLPALGYKDVCDVHPRRRGAADRGALRRAEGRAPGLSRFLFGQSQRIAVTSAVPVASNGSTTNPRFHRMSATATFIDCPTVSVAATPRTSCTLIRSWARQLTRTPPTPVSGSRQTPPLRVVVQRQAGLEQRGGHLHDQRGQRVGVGQQVVPVAGQPVQLLAELVEERPLLRRGPRRHAAIGPPDAVRRDRRQPAGQGGPVGVDPVAERAGHHLADVVDQPPACPAGGQLAVRAHGDVDRLGLRREFVARLARRPARVPAGWLPCAGAPERCRSRAPLCSNS